MFRRSTLSIRWRRRGGNWERDPARADDMAGMQKTIHRAQLPIPRRRLPRFAPRDRSRARRLTRGGAPVVGRRAANGGVALGRCVRVLRQSATAPAFLAQVHHRVSSTQVRQCKSPATDFCTTLPCRERSLRSRLALVAERTPREYATKSRQEVSRCYAICHPTRASVLDAATRPAPLNSAGGFVTGVCMGRQPVSRGLHFTSGGTASLAADRMASSLWQDPVSHRERPGARLTRRDEGAYSAYVTEEQRSSGGMHGRSNAAGLLPQAARCQEA